MSDHATQTREVPPQAFRVPVNCQFASKDDESGTTPVTLLARTAEPVQHWYWGAIHHDFAGMSVNPSIAIDYCHDDDQIIGVGDSFTVDKQGLTIGGKLVSLQAGDRADDVTRKAALGIPYEASIDFRGDDLLIEEVRDGFTAQVNGKQIEGPALIFRQWPLRGVAICPHGMDRRTATQFSQGDDDPVIVRIYSQGSVMPTAKTKTGPGELTTSAKPEEVTPPEQQTQPQTPAQQQSAETSAGSVAADSGDAAAQWRADLKRYVDKFGAENGTKWYTAGKTYSEALELHVESLNRQLAAKDETAKQLSDKLKALHVGEENPATFSTDEQEETPDAQGSNGNRFAHMGRAGVFASHIKIPRRSN